MDSMNASVLQVYDGMLQRLEGSITYYSDSLCKEFNAKEESDSKNKSTDKFLGHRVHYQTCHETGARTIKLFGEKEYIVIWISDDNDCIDYDKHITYERHDFDNGGYIGLKKSVMKRPKTLKKLFNKLKKEFKDS